MKIIKKKEKTQNKKNKWYISFEEREMIEKLLKEKVSIRKIAKIIWRWKSTIWDEISRYKTHASWYEACLAQKQFLRNQKRKWNKLKIENNFKMKSYIEAKLKDDWSPEQIAWRLKKFRNNPNMADYIWYVCHETIYNYIYNNKEAKKEKLYKNLRRHKTKRTKWFSRKTRKKEIIKNKVSIHNRPKKIDNRKRIWDWESDSVLFSKQKQVLNVNVERKSRIVRLELVKDKSARSSIEVQKRIVAEMEEYWIETYSYTFDNWTENVLHEELHNYWVKTYFCDPYSSYQKGSVENMNMFIRQYLPRNTNLSKLTNEDLNKIEAKLNNRPRKCLGYLSPNEYFYKETSVKIE